MRWVIAASSPQDKYTPNVPGGLAFSEVKGYESWQTISVSRNERLMAVIVGNPAMIDDVDFMVNDSERFADGGGWAFAMFVEARQR